MDEPPLVSLSLTHVRYVRGWICLVSDLSVLS